MKKLLFACAAWLLPLGAWACSCVEVTDDLSYEMRNAFENSDAVVVAKALSITVLPPPDDHDLDIDPEIHVTDLNAIISFKGDVPPRFQTKIETVCCVCGFTFAEGETYLLFLYEEEDGFYSTNICTRNMFFEDAREAIEVIMAELL